VNFSGTSLQRQKCRWCNADDADDSCNADDSETFSKGSWARQRFAFHYKIDIRKSFNSRGYLSEDLKRTFSHRNHTIIS